MWWANSKQGNPGLTELVNAHLEAAEPECRWCFAIDLQRVPGKILNTYRFPDSLLLHLKCPRCGKEFTSYSEGWSEDYLEGTISTLHPELSNRIDSKLLDQVHDLLFPEFLH